MIAAWALLSGPGILRGKDVAASIEEIPPPKNPYQQFLDGEIDGDTLDSLVRERRARESPTTAVGSGRDLSASIKEIIANEKDPRTVLFVLGASLMLGKEVAVDRGAAKQFLEAALQFQHAGAAWFLGEIAEEEEPRDNQWQALGYYMLAIDLFLDNPAAYSPEVWTGALKDCRERQARLEAKLDLEGRYLALTFVRTKLKELWGI